jgi:UDP-galactopyranose mutase
VRNVSRSHSQPDVLCLSHLRWNFVFQRPQHLLTRCAQERRVFYIEEPLFDAPHEPCLEIDRSRSVVVVVPHLPKALALEDTSAIQRALLDNFIEREQVGRFLLWYYTPMALAFSDHLNPELIVYDCMDELSAFKNAPAVLKDRERRLLTRADLVFTGGHSLYEAKRGSHPNVHAFPSSVDAAHFGQARQIHEDAPDQAGLARPRLGFFGVLDERFDIELIAGVASARPDWQLVLVGPVVNINK